MPHSLDRLNCAQPLNAALLVEVTTIMGEMARQGLDLQKVMAVVAARSMEITGATGAVVEILDRTAAEMIYEAVAGSAVGQLGLRLPAATSLSGLCVDRAQPLSCGDSERDPRVNREACRKVGLRSMLCVPLFYDDAAVGVLKVLSSRPYQFGEGDVAVLALLAEMIGASMYNAARFNQDALFRAATTDRLTGLANRALFEDRARHAIAQAKREANLVGVLLLDMDGLKAINDQQGHASGDRAIQAIAGRIQATIRQTDTAARLGGDEFAVILIGVEHFEAVTVAVERLRSQCDQPLLLDGLTLPLGASIGAAVYPNDSKDLEALLKLADERMYTAKRDRKASREL